MTRNLLDSCRILAATVILQIFFYFSRSAALSYIFFTAVLVFFRKELNLICDLEKPFSFKRVMIYVPLFIVLSVILSLLFPQAQSPMIEKNFINAFLITMLGPFYEELFFRKLLPTAFGKYSAPVISSLIFGLFHGIDRFIPAFFAGLVLYFIYKESDDIKIPFIVHSTNNIMAYVFM